MPQNSLDELDSRIIYELDFDSRQPLSKLSKRLHISVQRLDYRLHALEKRGVIIAYPAVVNLRKLGSYQYFICCIRTYRMSSREQDEWLRSIAKDGETALAYGCEGAWDAIIGTVVDDIFKAKEVFGRLLAPIEHHIRQKLIYTDMRIYAYGRRYMFEHGYGRLEAGGAVVFDQRKHKYMLTGGPAEQVNHGEMDLTILRILSEDSRTPSVKIAKLAGTTPETVIQHIRRMEKSGIIEGYTTLLEPRKYGYQFTRIIVQLASNDEERLQEIIEYMKRFPNMFRLIELFEIDGFMMDLVCHNQDEMESILADFRDRYREHILEIDSARISKVYKATYFPTFEKAAENGKLRKGRGKIRA